MLSFGETHPHTPFLAHELCRERIAVYASEGRSDTAHIKAGFPKVQECVCMCVCVLLCICLCIVMHALEGRSDTAHIKACITLVCRRIMYAYIYRHAHTSICVYVVYVYTRTDRFFSHYGRTDNCVCVCMFSMYVWVGGWVFYVCWGVLGCGAYVCGIHAYIYIYAF